MVIMMVNGNVGAGVAVAGAFGLVRFRSVPGTAKEMDNLLAMGAGLATGMGYLAYAVLFVAVMGAATLLYARLGFGNGKNAAQNKTSCISPFLKIWIIPVFLTNYLRNIQPIVNWSM